MADATRLTRAGDMRAATAAIQAALHGSSPSADAAASVIDVEAREVHVGRDIEAPVPPARPSGDAGRFIAGCHVHAAGTRDYKLYVPPGYQGQPLPLVVMLHGCTQNPDDFAIGTRMNEAAFERDFFVLYPAQAQNANASRCWNWFKHNHQRRGRGEPALLADMTRDIVNRYGMDDKRVYVAGLSAGGAMAAILGEAYPDLFAAVGVHSGLPPRSATNAKTAFDAMRRGAPADAEPSVGAAPAIVFHGDHDKTVHPINGQQIVAARAGATTPETELKRSKDGRGVTQHVYRDADGRVVAEHWVVHGAGHAWSGGSPRGSYTDPKGPDATEEMLRFFFARPR
jgi:poly(hydroxyalkanoate) depolymerase family esterase